jgi:hypothetical protein
MQFVFILRKWFMSLVVVIFGYVRILIYRFSHFACNGNFVKLYKVSGLYTANFVNLRQTMERGVRGGAVG